MSSSGGQVADLTADLGQVRAQRTPYLPASATIVHLGGQAALRIAVRCAEPAGTAIRRKFLITHSAPWVNEFTVTGVSPLGGHFHKMRGEYQ